MNEDMVNKVMKKKLFLFLFIFFVFQAFISEACLLSVARLRICKLYIKKKQLSFMLFAKIGINLFVYGSANKIQ